MGEFRREVLPPRPALGFGLTAPIALLVVSLFVAMAMATLSWSPRPRAHPRAMRAPSLAPPAAARDPRVACRAVVHRAEPDGTVSAELESCVTP